VKRLVLILTLMMLQGVAFGAGVSASTKTPTEKLQIRLRQQNIQIQRDVKTGKLTKDQAKSLKTQVEAVRKQEIADMKLNGTKTLTDNQVAQLNEQLNTLSKSIPIK
jgi:uncharacterized protein involved in exopolysaccharide biosynthesis